MAFHVPLFSLVNVFVHVLMEPDRSTVETDLSLIDIGVAHFLRLELLTESKISLPFSKDLAKLAQKAVKHSKTASQLVQHASNSNAGGMEVNDLVNTVSLVSHDVYST